MLTLSFGSTGEDVSQRVQERFPRLVVELVKTVDRMNVIMQARIVRDKLQGQVLHHRTGKLANSIRIFKAKYSNDVIEGGVQGAGGPAFYGRYHEFGTTHSYEIKPIHGQALAFIPQGNVSLDEQRSIMRGIRNKSGPMTKRQLSAQNKARNAFTAAGGVIVKVVHHGPIQKRSFMQSTLDEMRDEIFNALQATVDKVMSEGA